MAEPAHDEAAIIARLRAAWDQALREQEGLEVRIELLTADGQPGQPLAYDIIERTSDSLATYTLVELPDATRSHLGLDEVLPSDAHTTLVALLDEARDAAPHPVAATILVAYQPAPTLGVTWGYHRLPNGDAMPFETSYRHWFTSEILLRAQRDSTAQPWTRLTLTRHHDSHILAFG